ncbi:MAG: HAD family hydrolase [Eubacteriales bacterium]|nr:HAD family hydrolase [Eubacteriales bacterium]
MKKYTTVIFDLDGTLLDTLEDLTNAVNQALREGGFGERTLEEVKGFVGNGIGKLISRALPAEANADPEAYTMTLQAFSNYYALHNNDSTAPYPGVPELLTALRKAKRKLAVVSNKNDPNVKALCRTYFSEAIDEAIGEQEGVRRKPEPDTVLRVMESLGASPAETLYVGDSDVDVETARNAGVDCAAVLWGFRSEEHLRKAGAENLFATPEALRDWILKKH